MAQQLEEENELINKNNINEQVSNGKATAADHSGSFDGAINQILINNDSENYSEGVKSTILPIHDSEEPPTTYLHNNESLTIESAVLPISSSNLHECPPTDEELLKMVDKNLTILMNTVDTCANEDLPTSDAEMCINEPTRRRFSQTRDDMDVQDLPDFTMEDNIRPLDNSEEGELAPLGQQTLNSNENTETGEVSGEDAHVCQNDESFVPGEGQSETETLEEITLKQRSKNNKNAMHVWGQINN
nr:unnamed protein product [Callosobruchus analis]